MVRERTEVIVDTHPPRPFPPGGKGCESPSVVRGQAIKCMTLPPDGQRMATCACVKAKPCGWPSASLDASAHREQPDSMNAEDGGWRSVTMRQHA